METLNHAHLHEVLLRAFKTQDELNSRLTPLWKEQGWPYYRAIWTEAAEASSHANWMWWKQSTFGQAESGEQLEQIRMEMCDILHFGMSSDLIYARTVNPDHPDRHIDYCARMYAQWFSIDTGTTREFHRELEKVVVGAIKYEEFAVESFAYACRAIGMTLPSLLTLYFGKATLNKFRWNNGYALPKNDPKYYRKMWPNPKSTEMAGYPDVEDNVHLTGILTSLIAKNKQSDLLDGLHSGALQAGIYERLRMKYPGPDPV